MTENESALTPKHVSVLLQECIDNLNIKPDGIYLDGTLGMGGHSFEIASRLRNGRLIGIDRDETAIERAGRRLAPFMDKITLVHGNFSDASSILDSLGIDGVDGMLFDILWDYGEERYARRITAAILRAREQKPIESTLELVELIKSAMPAPALREKQHPAKRSFQAIRIAVNDELGAISQMMETAPDKLKVGGRLCVISFHSLEDRIVKSGIQARENGCTCPREAPICTCGFVKTLRSVSRKPILPTPRELAANPRARSAKLRVAERV